jgi:protein TonB
MANQSIYSERWIDLVFENRNKEYGAYQLRQENPKTTLKALGIGMLLLISLVSIPVFMQKFGTPTSEIVCELPFITPIEMKSVVFPPEKKPEQQTAAPLTQKKNDQPKPEVDRSNLVNPTISEAHNAKTEIATNKQAQETYVEPIDGALTGIQNTGVLGGNGTDVNKNANPSNGTDSGPVITAVLDKQPEFPGGLNKFYSYVAKNFNTPDTEIANTIKVYVSFVIEKDGSMTDIRVPRNPGFGLDKEAIRVLRSLKTKWSPGILNGKPVRTTYNLPIVVEQK